MNLTCNRCGIIYNIVTERESIYENCKIKLDLFDQELLINDERIKKLEKNKKSEIKNPKNIETHLETIKRIEHNLQIEYKKRDGIIKTLNSKDTF